MPFINILLLNDNDNLLFLLDDDNFFLVLNGDVFPHMLPLNRINNFILFLYVISSRNFIWWYAIIFEDTSATKFVYIDGILGIQKIFIAKNIVLINWTWWAFITAKEFRNFQWAMPNFLRGINCINALEAKIFFCILKIYMTSVLKPNCWMGKVCLPYTNFPTMITMKFLRKCLSWETWVVITKVYL